MYGSSPKLDAMDPGPIVSDAEITSSIKNTMNMLKTMSLPLSLLKGAASIDAFADAFKVRPPLHAFCTCISARITCRAFSNWPVKFLGCTLAYLVKTCRCIDCLVCYGQQQEEASAFGFGRAASLRRPMSSGAQVDSCTLHALQRDEKPSFCHLTHDSSLPKLAQINH